MCLYTRKLLGFNGRQFIKHRFHVGGFYDIKPYLKKVVMGLNTGKFVYDLVFQYFFVKKITYLLSNCLRTYYDKLLFINSHPDYGFIFKPLCELIDMPFLYTKWAYGTLSNVVYFYRGASRIVKNNLQGFYDLTFLPAMIVNLNGLHNFASLWEARSTGGLVCGILDYDLDVIKDKFIFFDKYGYFNYFFLGNDDNVKSLNYVMYLIIIAIFYRKVFLYNMFFMTGYKGRVPYYISKKTFPVKLVNFFNGSFVYFYKGYGSSNYLRRFYWYRTMRDYHFFKGLTAGNYERLAQLFCSLYSFHVNRHVKFLLFFKKWVKINKNFYFFNLQDLNLTQHLHVLFLSVFMKNKFKLRKKVFNIKYTRFKTVIDKLSITTFFTYEKFYYKQLLKTYSSLPYHFNINLKHGQYFRYYKYVFNFCNMHGHKIINNFKNLITTFMYLNKGFKNITLNLHSKFKNMYTLTYQSNFFSYFRILYSLKKKLRDFELGFLFFRGHEESFSLNRGVDRNFFKKIPYYFNKNKLYLLWFLPFVRFRYILKMDYDYYFDFYKDLLLEQSKRAYYFKARFKLFFFYKKNLKKRRIILNCGFVSFNTYYNSFFFKPSVLT